MVAWHVSKNIAYQKHARSGSCLLTSKILPVDGKSLYLLVSSVEELTKAGGIKDRGNGFGACSFLLAGQVSPVKKAIVGTLRDCQHCKYHSLRLKDVPVIRYNQILSQVAMRYAWNLELPQVEIKTCPRLKSDPTNF